MKRKFVSIALACVLALIPCVSTTTSAAHTDPNGDGVINITDAVHIMSYLGGGFEPSNPADLDFDCNGIISYMDYMKVQMYLAHIWLG